MNAIKPISFTSTKPKKSLFLIASSSIGLILAVPVALAALIIWQDSLARQIFIAGTLISLTLFALKKEKYHTLILSMLFFTQFATSLHTFELREPLRFQIYFLDIIIVMLFLASAELKTGFKLDGIGKNWLFIMTWMLVTTYFSARTDKSILFLIMITKTLIVYAIFRNIQFDERFTEKIVLIVCVILVIQGLISGFQYIKNGHLGLVVLGERNPETSKLHYVKDSLRVSGTLGAVNALGGYIAVLMVFLTPFVLAGKKNKLVYVIYGLSYITLIIPFSRSGWLSYLLGASLCVVNLLRSKSITFGKVLLLGTITSIFLLASAFTFKDKIMDRFEDKRAIASAEGRAGQFIEAMDVIKRYPMTGIGPGVTEFFGAWKEEERKYVAKALPGVNMYNQYHNSFLQFWVENGALGAILFIIFIFSISLNALLASSRIRHIQNPPDKLLVIGAAAAAFSYLVHTSFGPEINNERLLTTFAIFLGLSRNKKYTK